MVYDPVKAHEYYERTKELKGRASGGRSNVSIVQPKKSSSNGSKGPNKPSKSETEARDKAMARVNRLEGKVQLLEQSLSKALATLSKKRIEAAREEKKNSDGKTTAKERQSSKEYREKNREKINDKTAEKRKSKSGGSSRSSGSSSKKESGMSVADLESRISKIRSTLRDAKHQLANSKKKLGQLTHSAITSDPMFEANFARFQSAERIPSK